MRDKAHLQKNPWEIQDTKTQMIHKKHGLGTVSKNNLREGLNRFANKQNI